MQLAMRLGRQYALPGIIHALIMDDHYVMYVEGDEM